MFSVEAQLAASRPDAAYSRFLVTLPLRQIFVKVKARLGVLLRLMPEEFGLVGAALREHLEERFHPQIVCDFARRCTRIENERVLALSVRSGL